MNPDCRCERFSLSNIRDYLVAIEEEFDIDIVDRWNIAEQHYNDDRWESCIRDIGIIVEDLADSLHTSLSTDLSAEKTGHQLHNVHRHHTGARQQSGVFLSTVWWFRNKASHSCEYNIDAADIESVLINFQMGLRFFLPDQPR